MREFVVFDEHGREVDRIDPVVEFEEAGDQWRVDNGYGVYTVTCLPGQRYEIREREDETDGE